MSEFGTFQMTVHTPNNLTKVVNSRIMPPSSCATAVLRKNRSSPLYILTQKGFSATLDQLWTSFGPFFGQGASGFFSKRIKTCFWVLTGIFYP